MMLLPELYMLFFSILFLFLSLGKKKISLFTAARVLSLVGFIVTLVSRGRAGRAFFRRLPGGFLLPGVQGPALGGLLSRRLHVRERRHEEDNLPEFFMFLGFSTLGLMMLVSSVELISIVISLEISSFSLYAIVPLRKGPDADPARGGGEVPLLRRHFDGDHALRDGLSLRHGPFDLSRRHHGQLARCCFPSRWGSWPSSSP